MGDLSKARGIIDQTTSAVNIGIMEPNKKTGIMELTKNVMPVSVAKRLIVNPIAAFDFEGTMQELHKTTGVDIASLISASSTTKTGQLIKAEGLEKLVQAGGLDRFKGTPEYDDLKKVVDLANKSINQAIQSKLVNPNDLLSVVTDQSGMFDANSLTDKIDEVKADPKHKILMVVDPNTGTLVMDKSAPNYDQIKKSAVDYMTTDYFRRNKTDIAASIVPQLHELQQKIPRDTSAETKAKEIKDRSQNIGQNVKDYLTGDKATANLAGQALAALTGQALYRTDDQTIESKSGNASRTFDIKGQSYEKTARALMALLKDVPGINTEDVLKIALQNAPSAVSKVGTIKAEREIVDEELEYINTINELSKKIPITNWGADKTKTLEALNSSKLSTQMGYSFDLSGLGGLGGEIIIYSGIICLLLLSLEHIEGSLKSGHLAVKQSK
jgi:hypothetical protein